MTLMSIRVTVLCTILLLVVIIVQGSLTDKYRAADPKVRSIKSSFYDSINIPESDVRPVFERAATCIRELSEMGRWFQQSAKISFWISASMTAVISILVGFFVMTERSRRETEASGAFIGNKRQRIINIIMALMSIIATILSTFAYRLTQEADLHRSNAGLLHNYRNNAEMLLSRARNAHEATRIVNNLELRIIEIGPI